jgi:probable DNA repair protein
MGLIAASEIDAWLRGDGVVVTASDRAARALSSAFHRARQDEGLSAWPAPNILDWKSFVRAAWQERAMDGRLIMNPNQEEAIWASIAGSDAHIATLLDGPRHRLANLAMEAHELLCLYAPHFLRSAARSNWQQDAGAFSDWLIRFEQACRAGNLFSGSRLPLELIAILEQTAARKEGQQRPPLLLVGFDRLLPVQRSLCDAWGKWRFAASSNAAEKMVFHKASDVQAELAACALWCKDLLSTNPRARLLVISQDIANCRGEIERAFLYHASPEERPAFEFSLGVPLSQIPLAQSALLLLRWLSGPVAEHELDWLFSTRRVAANSQENAALQSHMRALRRRGLQQPSWSLPSFIEQARPNTLPSAWVARITATGKRLNDLCRETRSPLDWAELVPQLLEDAAWPGADPLTSVEFQAGERWQGAIEICGSLGFDGRRVHWNEFVSDLTRGLETILFSPESQGAPILIAGPAESAGLAADGIWFLGATEDAWPAVGPTHPLLPPGVQREAGMPHATPQLDWDLASAITDRLRHFAREFRVSYSGQKDGVDVRPSRLIVQAAGAPLQVPNELSASRATTPGAVPVYDTTRIPFPAGNVAGGASLLTFQSQCPFKAFATARLGAQSWERAEAGLTAAQRGQLLHAVLHSIWGGPPEGIRGHAELEALQDRRTFVEGHVRRALRNEMGPTLRRRMPARYLQLEERRLIRLVTEWLNYELTRIAFQVTDTELNEEIPVAGLSLGLRIDRIDRLIDGSMLVIDYKTGNVSRKSWEMPRPDDVQLPLYARFALDGDVGGLVFGKVRPGDCEVEGYVGDANATLISGLKSTHSLVKKSLQAEQLIDWSEYIEKLARDFLSGNAEVNPRDYPKTCERCGLQTLCRIQENRAALDPEEEVNENGDVPDA